MRKPIDTSELGPIKLGPVATARDRVRKVAHGATINGTYRQFPEAALESFRNDLKELVDDRHYPTEDAYLAACRANHWRAAQLRALGAEPLDLSKLPKDQLTHYPPDDFQWGDSGLTVERIADAMQKAIESNTHPSYVDNLGDGESIIIDGTVNLAVLAEELRR